MAIHTDESKTCTVKMHKTTSCGFNPAISTIPLYLVLLPFLSLSRPSHFYEIPITKMFTDLARLCYKYFIVNDNILSRRKLWDIKPQLRLVYCDENCGVFFMKLSAAELRGISLRLTSFVISLLRGKLRGIKPSFLLKISISALQKLLYIDLVLVNNCVDRYVLATSGYWI